MSYESRICVDVKRPIGKIDPKIYGFNIEHIRNLETGHSLIYGALFDERSSLSDEHGFRRDVVDACKRIKVPILRGPGGNFVSGYHWLDGVGPRDERPMLYELAWKSEETNRFGTDEFMEFCKLIGTEPFITVNSGSGTAEEATRWVEYCNRKGNTRYAKLREKNGHPEPYGVTYWSLGNEAWGDFQIGHLEADEYARKARDYAKLMRRVDQGIKLTAVGSGLGTDPEWDLTVLGLLADPFIYHGEATDLIDTISTHAYYSMFLNGNEEEYYYQVLACPLDAERKLRIKKSILDVALSKLESARGAFPYIREREIGIAFDEWNISGCHTLRDALAICRVLNVFQRLSDWLKIGCFFPLIHQKGSKEEDYSSPITAYEDGIVLEAGYHAFDLYVNHTGSTAVETYVECKTYDQEFEPRARVWNSWAERSFGKLSFRDVPYLDSSTTLSSDGKTLYVATVNTHRDENEDCLIELRGCSPQGTARVFELNARDVNAYNDKGTKDNVKTLEKAGIRIDQKFTYNFPPHSATVIEIPIAGP